MKKNSQIHLYINSDFIDYLKRQAVLEGISFSELCRRKLDEYSRLARIEYTLEEINRKLSRRKNERYLKSRVSVSVA